MSNSSANREKGLRNARDCGRGVRRASGDSRVLQREESVLANLQADGTKLGREQSLENFSCSRCNYTLIW